ncbi:MAG: Asp-tRNA(Asn)/Glu-tRNA(Gln) amidotransferase subunit GatC [Bryobacteraceae bacterium]
MKIDSKQVRTVADLANLRLTDAEVERMAREMDSILSHMDKLNELDTADVPPMAQVLYEADDTASMRDDAVRPCLSNEAALASAPLAGAGMFKVPRVVEK